jgi:hypothetical protein
MHRALRWAGSVVLLAAVITVAWAGGRQPPGEPPKQPPQSAAEQYQALVKEVDDAMQQFMKEYNAAKTDEEKQKLFNEKYPQPQKYAARFLKIAEQHPDDPAAVDALVWVITRAGAGSEQSAALEKLARNHVTSAKVGAVSSSLVYSQSPLAEPFLRDVLAKNPDRGAKGQAALALGQYLKREAETIRSLKENAGLVERLSAMVEYGPERVKQLMAKDPVALLKESETVFERVAKDFADVKSFDRPLGPLAEGELFEARHLAVGKPAPEIEGEDIDGVKFKLSDYRGKVVMIDFWGHW